MKQIVALYVVMQCLYLGADYVHVTQTTHLGGNVDIVSDAIMLTGLEYESITPPTIANYIFTHWTISTKQPFSSRDEWGVSRDVVTFKLYEDTILTSNYISDAIDEDVDGIPDGYELYWYGDLSKDAESDTDGDGFTFAEEIANGTNPVTAEYENGDIVRYCDGEVLTYNPNGYKWVSVRSEPDGSLLEASSVCLRPATWFETVEFSPETSAFAYWICNGKEVRDEWGRAIDKISFMMSTNDVNLVAVAVDDYETRMKLYWYGTVDIAMDSDTDGDGFMSRGFQKRNFCGEQKRNALRRFRPLNWSKTRPLDALHVPVCSARSRTTRPHAGTASHESHSRIRSGTTTRRRQPSPLGL